MLSLARLSVVCFGLLGALPAGAETTYTETLVHDTTKSVEIKLSAETVLCSSADYGALFLKILIPELAGMTLLDHQNTGAGAPCVAAGMCKPGRMPEDIIDAAYPTAKVDINVKAVRLDEADSAAQTCSTHLIERVAVKIRGFDFVHERSVALGSRPFSDCATAPAPATGDDKSDEQGTVDAAKPDTGGCATTHGDGAGLLLVLLGAVFAVRRRRAAR